MPGRSKILKKPGWKDRRAEHEAWLVKMGVKLGKPRKARFRGDLASPLEARTLERESPRIESAGSLIPGSAPPRRSNAYSGDALLGVGTMHKSNAVPVSSKEAALEIARMRRGG